MMFNNHYCIQGICNRGFTLDCVLDILWIGFIFVTDKNWFYLVSICILNSYDEVRVIEITKEDYSMALNITNYSVNMAFKLIEPTATKNPENGKENKSKQKICKKTAIPTPEQFTMEYALENGNFVRRLSSTATTSWDNS